MKSENLEKVLSEVGVNVFKKFQKLLHNNLGHQPLVVSRIFYIIILRQILIRLIV